MKKIIEYNLRPEDMLEEFYPKLKDKVFHYTSGTNLKSILEQNFIFPIKNDVQSTSAHSHESMGRYLNAVCLFDLRNKPTDQIEKIRGWYNFLEPRFKDNTLVYFIISSDHYSDITTLSDLTDEVKEKGMYLPHIESWHRNQIPLEKIETIYKVNLLQSIGRIRAIIP
jgi:hypothetical protein